MPIGNYPIYAQYGLPQMVIPQMNIQQRPVVYAVPVAYNYQGVYQNTQQQQKPKITQNNKKSYSNKKVTTRYYTQYDNQDDGCSIQ